MFDANLLSQDVRRPRRPPRPFGRVVRHRGTIDKGVLTLERGGWIRAIDAQGEQLSDLFDERFLCRLELGDTAVITAQHSSDICTVVITGILADWGRKFAVTGALFRGACFVLPCTGLRR